MHYILYVNYILYVKICTIYYLFLCNCRQDAASNIEQVLEAAPNKAAAVRPPTIHHENYQN